jgi:hypothetical protein
MDYAVFPWTGDGLANVMCSAPFLRYLYLDLPGCTYDAISTLSHLKWLSLRASGARMEMEDEDAQEQAWVEASFDTSTKALAAIFAFIEANPGVERMSIDGRFRDHHHAELEAVGLVSTSKTCHWFKGTHARWEWPRPRSFE